jgi:hypothetical protein
MAKRRVAKKASPRKAAKKTAARKGAKKKQARAKTSRKQAVRAKTGKKQAKTGRKQTRAKSGRKQPARPKTWSAAQLRDYKAIQGRAERLGKTLTDADFDAQGKPIDADWSRLLAELDAWAAKYRVRLTTQEHEHGTGGPVPLQAGGCPGSFETEHTYLFTLSGRKVYHYTACTLRRRTLLGRCVYSCTDATTFEP